MNTPTPTPTSQPMPVILYTGSIDRMINHALVQRPITSRPQPMFPCHCKHILALASSYHRQFDAAWEAAMDRNNN